MYHAILSFVCPQRRFASESQGHLFTYHGDKELIRKYAPIMPALPYNLSPSGQKLFMVQHAKQQLKEYHRYIATRGTKLWTEVCSNLHSSIRITNTFSETRAEKDTATPLK